MDSDSGSVIDPYLKLLPEFFKSSPALWILLLVLVYVVLLGYSLSNALNRQSVSVSQVRREEGSLYPTLEEKSSIDEKTRYRAAHLLLQRRASRVPTRQRLTRTSLTEYMFERHQALPRQHLWMVGWGTDPWRLSTSQREASFGSRGTQSSLLVAHVNNDDRHAHTVPPNHLAYARIKYQNRKIV
ncbi:hypothetical protein LZ554_008602 [Drepanopeziza brunnea f. sp. 'monogermtubi']|nr:hypothetical protein LZ554_008602 [Drepanopeziza brunnea f. sp. 'monogermtubi']